MRDSFVSLLFELRFDQSHSSNYRGHSNVCTFSGISSSVAGVKSYSTVPLGIRSSPGVTL